MKRPIVLRTFEVTGNTHNHLQVKNWYSVWEINITASPLASNVGVWLSSHNRLLAPPYRYPCHHSKSHLTRWSSGFFHFRVTWSGTNVMMIAAKNILQFVNHLIVSRNQPLCFKLLDIPEYRNLQKLQFSIFPVWAYTIHTLRSPPWLWPFIPFLLLLVVWVVGWFLIILWNIIHGYFIYDLDLYTICYKLSTNLPNLRWGYEYITILS